MLVNRAFKVDPNNKQSTALLKHADGAIAVV